MDSTEKYYSERALDYAQANSVTFPSLMQLLELAQSFLPRKEMIYALDWGCGHGRDMQTLVDAGYTVSGIDRSRELLEIAQQNLPNAVFPDATEYDQPYQLLVQADLTELPSPLLLSSQDLIWSIASFCHIKREDAVSALKIACRMLNKDGIIAISTKEGKGEGIEPNSAGDADLFYTRYDEIGLANVLGLAGFKALTSRVITLPNGQRWIETIAQKYSSSS